MREGFYRLQLYERLHDLGVSTTSVEGTTRVLTCWAKAEPFTVAVILDFKDKIRYAPYVSFRSQISHIATIKG